MAVKLLGLGLANSSVLVLGFDEGSLLSKTSSKNSSAVEVGIWGNMGVGSLEQKDGTNRSWVDNSSQSVLNV